MSKLLLFEKLHNTRDLGGMKTADGRTVQAGRLFRSGHLSDLTAADADVLSELIDCAVDFRTVKERTEQPDREIDGVKNIHIPVMENLTPGISREEESDKDVFSRYLDKPEDAKKYMCDVYQSFAGDYAVKQYRDFIRLLADSQGRILWHCTAGKDRAGIASALVEELLGVPRKEIIKDYLRTNEYIRHDVAFLTEFVKRQCGTDNPGADESLHYLFGAEEDYIRTFYETIDEKYGSFEAFVREGLEVSMEMEEELKKKYLYGNPLDSTWI